MATYTCDKCGNTVTYLIEDICQECFLKLREPDWDRVIDERREREAERKVRRAEGNTINFVKREGRG